MLRPQLQDGQTIANAGLGHGQLVLACARKQYTSVYEPVHKVCRSSVRIYAALCVFRDIYIVQIG